MTLAGADIKNMRKETRRGQDSLDSYPEMICFQKDKFGSSRADLMHE
jgi:hypothetical protein